MRREDGGRKGEEGGERWRWGGKQEDWTVQGRAILLSMLRSLETRKRMLPFLPPLCCGHTLGRNLGWPVGDRLAARYFLDVLLGPIQRDLIEWTWLTERYTCDGLRERATFFFEYPCLLAMMLKEMKCVMSCELYECEACV